MFSNSKDEASFVKADRCECYKKLHLLGVPLYISEENDEYSEHREIVYENAFSIPESFRIIENVRNFPVVEENELSTVFLDMIQVIPSLADFEINPLSFWILDMFIEGLSTAQKAEFPHRHQTATLLWIAYFFNYIKQNNPSRKEMFNHLKTILFVPKVDGKPVNGSDVMSEGFGEESTSTDEKEFDGENKRKNILGVLGEKIWELPLPPDLDGNKEVMIHEKMASNDLSSNLTDAEEIYKSSSSSNTEIRNWENISNRNVKHMTIILEILYRIFGRLWAFMEIQNAFHAMPTVENVELPFVLNIPKPTQTTESPVLPKGERGGRKESISLTTPEEIEKERQLHKNDYILSLQESDEAKLYVEQNFGQPNSERSLPGKGKRKK